MKIERTQLILLGCLGLIAAAILTVFVIRFNNQESLSTPELSLSSPATTDTDNTTSEENSPSDRVNQIINSIYGTPYSQSDKGGAPFKAHPEKLHGTSGLDWGTGAQRGSMWNTSAWPSNPHITSWAECYEAASETGERKVRIHIKNLHTYVVDAAGQWKLIENKNVKEGTYHKEDWTAGGPSGNVRSEPDGGISFTMIPGSAFHPWSGAWPRTPISKNVKGILIKADFKLTANDGSANLSAAKFLCGVGYDIYPGPEATANDLKDNIAPGGGHPSFQWVTPNWQTFYFTNMSEIDVKRFGHP